jgi:hypothetical protein
VSLTAQTLTHLRQQGFIAGPVERWLPAINRRADAWGFADVLAANPSAGVVLLVQATTAAPVAARLAKARARLEPAAWLRAGGAFEIHGWCRRGGPKGMMRRTARQRPGKPLGGWPLRTNVGTRMARREAVLLAADRLGGRDPATALTGARQAWPTAYRPAETAGGQPRRRGFPPNGPAWPDARTKP